MLQTPLLRNGSLFSLFLLGIFSSAQASPPLYSPAVTPGTPEESALILKSQGASVTDNTRHADPGRFWVYGFAVVPGARCQLRLTLEDSSTAPTATVLGLNNKELPTKSDRSEDGTWTLSWTVEEKWPIGARLPVLISAKNGPVTVRQVQLLQSEPETEGVPNSMLALMAQGAPPNVHPVIVPAPRQPHTVALTAQKLDPTLDFQTDAILLDKADASILRSWKERGYTAWTLGGPRDQKEVSGTLPADVQTGANGQPATVEGLLGFAPTSSRVASEWTYDSKALDQGSDGICLPAPEYSAFAGYEGAFQQAWKQQFGSPWQAPQSSLDARWRMGQLTDTLTTNYVAGVFGASLQRKPSAQRIVSLHSPLWNAESGQIGPQSRLVGLSDVQEILGEVGLETSRTPLRYAGIRTERAFSLAYLQYSSLAQLARNSGKRLWFQINPVPDDPKTSPATVLKDYEQLVVAGLLFSDVDAYEIAQWPERIYGHLSADQLAEFNNIVATLQDMRFQPLEKSATAETDNIGVLVSDSMQWERAQPDVSDLEGVYGLALPLLQRGTPVQLVSLDRVADPGYLRPFKTLLLSYDFQKPLSARLQTALADWVRRGGSLLFFGGVDAYNGLTGSWWKTAGETAPQNALWRQLGLTQALVTRQIPAVPEDDTRFKTVLKSPAVVQEFRNRRMSTVDLTPFVQQTGSVAIRFENSAPGTGRGTTLAEAEIRIGKQLAAAFQTGSEMENRFLVYDRGSQYQNLTRFVDGNASWTYQFDNLPQGVPITLQLDMGNNYQISVASVTPDFTHTLVSDHDSGALGKVFPRVRIGETYPITVYPEVVPAPITVASNSSVPLKSSSADTGPSLLYNLRSGGAPVWAQQVDKGLVLTVGVGPGFFSSSERSATLLRGLTQYAVQRAGGVFHAPGYLQMQRGRYIMVRTFGKAASIDGRTIDLLSPTLNVANDRTIPERSYALLYNIGDEDSPPHIGFVSGRVQARLETDKTTAFFVRGPRGTTGMARLHSGGRGLAGAVAFDRLGHRIAVQADPEGNTLLLHYPNDPDGIVVRAGWN